MTAASRSLATALFGGALASGLLRPSYTTTRDMTARGTRGSLRRTLASTAAIAVGALWPLVHFFWLFALCDGPSERPDGAKI